MIIAASRAQKTAPAIILLKNNFIQCSRQNIMLPGMTGRFLVFLLIGYAGDFLRLETGGRAVFQAMCRSILVELYIL
jgi:hypothetical protein